MSDFLPISLRMKIHPCVPGQNPGKIFTSIHSAVKRISIRLPSLESTISRRLTGAALKVGWVKVVICGCNLQSEQTVSVCACEMMRGLFRHLPVSSREEEGYFGHKSCKYTAFFFIVKCERCNTVTLWLSWFRQTVWHIRAYTRSAATDNEAHVV